MRMVVLIYVLFIEPWKYNLSHCEKTIEKDEEKLSEVSDSRIGIENIFLKHDKS